MDAEPGNGHTNRNEPEVIDLESMEIEDRTGQNRGEYLPMYIHIGGSFIEDRNGKLRYVQGESTTWQVKPDYISVFEFYEKIRLCRFDVELVESIFYVEPNKSLDEGLRQIIGDDEVRKVIDVMKGHGEVHIYVDHIPNFAEIVPEDRVLMLPAPEDHLQPGGGVCSDAGGSTINEDELNEVDERRDDNIHEQDALFNKDGSYRSSEDGDHFVAGRDGQNDCCPNSDEEVSCQSTSDEEDSEAEHGTRRKARHPIFDESEGNQEIRLGMIFVNKNQFKKAVAQLSIREGREITWKKNDKVRMRAVCKDDKCDWKILLAMDSPTNSWMVKTFHISHTCSRTVSNKVCTSSVAADHLLSTRGAASLRMSKGDVFEAIRDELGVEFTAVQRKKTKDKLRKKFESGMPPVQPPPARKMAGRLTRKMPMEEGEGQTKMSRKGRRMTCQRCFQKGHNSRKCKAKGKCNEKGPTTDSQIPLTEGVNPPLVNDPMSVQNQDVPGNTSPATVLQQKIRVKRAAKRQMKKSSKSATGNTPTGASNATVETPQEPRKRVKTAARAPSRPRTDRGKSVGNWSK